MSVTQVIVPLYFYTILGFIAGRWLKIDAQQIAKLLIYLLTPIIIGGFVAQVPFSRSVLALPVGVFSAASLTAFLAWLVGGVISSFHPYRRLLAACGGMVNSGYFGIPVAVALIGESNLGEYMLAIFGFTLFEYVVGVYLINRQVYSPQDSLRRLLRLPGLYACGAGLVLSCLSVRLPPVVLVTITTLKAAYIVLGMMMLGLALSQRRFTLSVPFAMGALITRFALWTIAAWIVTTVDAMTFHLLTAPTASTILSLFSLLPIGANVIAYAVDSEASPEAVAPAVVLTTFLSSVLLWAFL